MIATRSAGPRALPAYWEPATGHARVAWPGPAPEPGLERQVSLCFDASRGSGPSAKAGLMLRGRCRVTVGRDVDLELERVTYWDGFTTATVEVDAPVPAATA